MNVQAAAVNVAATQTWPPVRRRIDAGRRVCAAKWPALTVTSRSCLACMRGAGECEGERLFHSLWAMTDGQRGTSVAVVAVGASQRIEGGS